jgi:ankyrin repeat protein
MNSFARESGHRAKKELILKKLPPHPDLDQIKRQAKELLTAFRAGDAVAAAQVNAAFQGGDPSAFALHDAQRVLARIYGFDSWPKLKAYVDGATVRRLADAIRAGHLPPVEALLRARPELASMEIDGLQPLHFAVQNRRPEIVRLLMRCGASARVGVYPHRDATSALTMAVERGYNDIVAIVEDAERGRLTPSPVEESAGPLTRAVTSGDRELLRQLLEQGLDPDERTRLGRFDEPVFSWGAPLWHCAGSARHEMARMLLDRGADPNARVYASGSPMFQAFAQRDSAMIELLRSYGGKPEATSAGLFRQSDLARRMLSGEADYLLDGVGGETLCEQLLWGGACGGDPEVVRMALEGVNWVRDDPRWFTILEQPLRIWRYGIEHEAWDRTTYLTCFRLVLERCDPNITARFGLTILHSVAGSRKHVTAEERVAFATMLLDAGARLDVRDELLRSTPLGWACRYGRSELVRLFLDRGADPEEREAEPWARPRAWAEKMGHEDILGTA